MSGKSSPEFQWTDDEIQLLLETTQNLKVEEDYSVASFYKKLPFLCQTLLILCFHHTGSLWFRSSFHIG